MKLVEVTREYHDKKLDKVLPVGFSYTVDDKRAKELVSKLPGYLVVKNAPKPKKPPVAPEKGE